MRLLIPPPLQGLIIGFAMWQIDRLTPALSLSIPGQKIIGGTLIATGIFIEVIAVIAFVRAKTTPNPLKPSNASTLVTDGLYRFSRNPMYLSLLGVLIGWAFWLGNPMNSVLLIAFVAYITAFQIKPEEEVLREKFGSDYDAYCQRVGRWV